MDTFTVYLFVRDRSQSHPPIAIEPRLQAQQALKEELVALGNVRVTALPHEADLQVEIKNVFGTNEGSAPGNSRAGHRVLIIGLLIGDELVEFVCADGIGNVPAEHHAAKHVLVWLHNLTHYQARAGGQVMTVNLCMN
jgi:hypothetical protein